MRERDESNRREEEESKREKGSKRKKEEKEEEDILNEKNHSSMREKFKSRIGGGARIRNKTKRAAEGKMREQKTIKKNRGSQRRK